MSVMFDGALVKKLLEEQGRTRRWFARECGIQYNSLTQVLNGYVQPGLPLLKLMAIRLNVDESMLMTKTHYERQASNGRGS